MNEEKEKLRDKLVNEYLRIWVPVLESYNRLMDELREEWEFFDSCGSPTEPWTDEVATADWIFRTIASIEDVYIHGLGVVDLSECPIEVFDWLSYVQANIWLAHQSDISKKARISDARQKTYTEQFERAGAKHHNFGEDAFERNVRTRLVEKGLLHATAS